MSFTNKGHFFYRVNPEGVLPDISHMGMVRHFSLGWGREIRQVWSRIGCNVLEKWPLYRTEFFTRGSVIEIIEMQK